MINLEFYKNEIKSLFSESTSINVVETVGHAFREFSKKYIKNYPFSSYDFIDWLLQEHKEQIKLKQWEYDLLSFSGIHNRFDSVFILLLLKEKGHFRGILDKSMSIKDIFCNCEIVPDDYDFAGAIQ